MSNLLFYLIIFFQTSIILSQDFSYNEKLNTFWNDFKNAIKSKDFMTIKKMSRTPYLEFDNGSFESENQEFNNDFFYYIEELDTISIYKENFNADEYNTFKLKPNSDIFSVRFYYNPCESDFYLILYIAKLGEQFKIVGWNKEGYCPDYDPADDGTTIEFFDNILSSKLKKDEDIETNEFLNYPFFTIQLTQSFKVIERLDKDEGFSSYGIPKNISSISLITKNSDKICKAIKYNIKTELYGFYDNSISNPSEIFLVAKISDKFKIIGSIIFKSK